MNPDHSKPEIVNKLEEIIKNSKGKISPADAAAATGYSLQDVEDSLARLIELYVCKVEVDLKEGKPVFNFAHPLRKRGKKTSQEIAFEILEKLYEVFKKIYKAAIGVILILYTVIFVVLLLVAMSRGGGDNRRKSGGGNLIAGLFSAIFRAFQFKMIADSMKVGRDSDNLHYRYYEKPKNKGKNFVQSVFDFVFGPERPEYDPLNDIKEVAAYIRKKSSVITSADIINLSGVNYDVADKRLTEYATKFRGNIFIKENGTALAEFNDISNTTSDLKGGQIEYFEDEVEPPYELTGNETGRNFIIMFMNAFNLLMSGNILFGQMGEQFPSILLIFLGWFPFIFSLLFFIIPAIRRATIDRKKAERSRNNVRKLIIGVIFRNAGGPVTLDEIMKNINLENHSVDEVESVISEVLTDLEGEIVIDSGGTAIYKFDRLKREVEK